MSAQPPGWCGGPDGGTPWEDSDEFVAPELVTVQSARNWRAMSHPRPHPGFTVEKSLALESPLHGYDYNGLVTPSKLGLKDWDGKFFDARFVDGPKYGLAFLGSAAGSEAMGIASPQLGMVSPWFIVSTPSKLGLKDWEGKFFDVRFFRRPHIVKFYGKEEYGIEGCLSIPGEKYEVLRWTKIDIEYLDENGELRKLKVKRNPLLARVIQHEYDHLCGVLISAKGHKV
jgi:peptide deformylase